MFPPVSVELHAVLENASAFSASEQQILIAVLAQQMIHHVLLGVESAIAAFAAVSPTLNATMDHLVAR